ncbi:P2Y purinoceptor 8-like [Anguilla anguilla]|uniref:P2Y purinoceptor 8-like n=1 Tax=Anguilla anguilla TaxID=7936 RepID=UPI0015AB4BD7|nr:P2Y purinoceptor 8-like [Anguilla anguilla]XP_035249145.1 P2Y purinoceptor 8-like [Anguilla anguilla]
MNVSSVPAPLANTTLEMLGSPILTLALPLVYLLVFVFSTPCNLISLWLLCLHAERRNPTVVFAINLSLTDLLYSAFLPFQVAYHLRGNDWPFGSAACSAVTVVFYTNMHCSILTTCAISLERYCGIVRPLGTRHWRTPRKAALACLLIWACVLAVHLPVLHNNLVLRVEQLNISTCFDVLPRALFPRKALGYVYFGTTLLLFTVLPLVVLIGCYVAIVRKLYGSRDLDTPQQAKRQTMRLIVVVVLCFTCCYLPTLVLHLLHAIYTTMGKSLYVYYKLSLGVNSLNCCFDPFIYYFASREFRQKFRAKIPCVAGDREETVTSDPGNASKGVSGHTVALLRQ